MKDEDPESPIPPNSRELKSRCPFCGDLPVTYNLTLLVTILHLDEPTINCQESDYPAVTCQKCGASGPRMNTIIEAIYAWEDRG